ncbi:MAG: hypothetical protein LBS94_02885 [Prevotellaceae bacterium]|nr:hypothetical protein [Prevotellaceae bacterium]
MKFSNLIFLALLCSCSHFSSQSPPENVLAEMGEKRLLLSDVKKIFPQTMAPADSLATLRAYIDSWVKKELMLRMAEENLGNRQKDVSALLDDYRTSLLVYRFEQKYIERVDTVISAGQYDFFYNNNREYFVLSRPIVRAIFIKLNRNSPYLERIKKLYTSSKSEDMTTLENLCLQAALRFDYFGDRWLTLDDIFKELPSHPSVADVVQKRAIDVVDNTYAYLVAIRDYIPREAVAPLEFERENIKTLILNQRRKSLITSLEQRILQDAVKNNRVKIYVNEK